MSFFNPQVSFCLNFATPFSVMTHNYSESFQLKHYMLWTKRAHQCTIFRLLGALMMKVHPILHAIFETTVSVFLLNFASLFNAMGDKSSVLFQLKLYLIFTKGAHHSAKFQTFDCSGEISPNLYFDRLLLLKVYKVSAKKSMEEICLMIPKSGAKFEEKVIFCFKNDKNLVNFDPNTKKSKKVTL